MAIRFMRLDLSDGARDFRPVALEPGVPMLDRSNANAKIIFRWLGGMVAEPVWSGDSVDFFVRDDHGGRLEEVVCQPVAADDLDKLLKPDLEKLRQRIESAKPETPTERAVKKMLRQSFESLVDDATRNDLDCYFFKYRDVQGRWRLVWCWGYRRIDQEAAAAVVCAEPECNLLFVRRPKQNAKCPCCEAALAAGTKRRTHWKRNLLAAMLLLLFVGGAIYWYSHPNRLVASPGVYNGPVGSRVEFKVENVGLFPFLKKDVTGQAVAVVLDPAVASFDPLTSAATLTGPGETLIRFHLGDLTLSVPLVSGKAGNPEKIVIEPGNVELAVGTTARLKLVGTYKNGARVDLTDAAEWTAQNDGIVFSYDGLLEGQAIGNTKVAARYRADAQSDYLDASAVVNVVDADLKSLELAIDPAPVCVGRASGLRIDAVSAEGKRYSVLESSLLNAAVEPKYLATVQQRHLQGKQVGSGKLAVTFNDTLTGGMAFDVVAGLGLDRLAVTPEKLDMVVGQITDLNVVSPSTAPIYVTSADPAVVEVNAENRLIARAEGSVNVEVAQGNQRITVPVKVATAQFAAIEVDPARLVVPVDHTIRGRVLAQIAGDGPVRKVEIAPDLLTCPKRPSPRYADFDASRVALHGVWPTEPSAPQALAFDFQGHQASAPVEVVVAPLRLTLRPAGPIDLPLGQQMRLQGWAHYSGGLRVQVPAGRLKFKSRSPAEAVAGLDLRDNKVAALKPNAGPLEVWAGYFNRESKPVVLKSVDADPAVTLRLDVDRTLRLTEETGRVNLSASGPKGDVELVPEMAAFQSSDPNILKIDEKSGAFRAASPGEATVACTHAAAKDPASLALKVHAPADVKLVFDPATARLAVDELAQLPLFLEARSGEKVERAELLGPGVGYVAAQPAAIRLSPPTVIGLAPAAPFELSASFYPYLSAPAAAQVEVVAAVEPAAIRVVPASVSLAPGQTIALKVEQQLPSTPEVWTEVRPDAVAWTVPPGLVFAEATAGLRPAVTGPERTSGEFELQSSFGGKQAICLITMKAAGPDPNDPEAKLVVVREPGGEYLAVGERQRYAIVVEKGEAREPAAQIAWPDDFENEFVRWQAPVLTAKKAGYRQWLRAEVGGRAVLWHTTTYQPSAGQPPAPDPDRPVAVNILSDQGQRVGFPVGAEFADFRVEAKYADGFTRLVTKKATLRTAEPAESSPLSFSVGRMLGVRPGRTAVHAEFEGVRSQQPLEVEVTAGLDVDEIRIAPAPITMLPGETVALDAVGYKGGKSVGIITRLGAITWQSSAPQIARVDGSAVTGVATGQTTVTAQLGNVSSPPAPVDVVASIADGLAVSPPVVRMRVGQSVRIGTDVAVLRGAIDLSGQCSVTPAIPGVVQYVPATQSLVGVSPGASAVAFTYGDKLVNAMVEVLPSGGAIDGEIVVEPAGGNLAAGQALPMRVYVLTPEGDRVDQTGSAVLVSSDPATVMTQGSLACALKPGTAEITATLPGARKPGKAYVTVNNEAITDLVVEPASLSLSTGQVGRVGIFGRATSGTYPMFPQLGLTVGAGGTDPGSIQIVGSNDVSAVRAGQAAVDVRYQNRLNRQVPVNVTDNPLTDLRLEPAQAVIHPGEPLVYQVSASRGGQRVVLGPENGVQLQSVDPSVARAGGDLAVLGANPGRTTVVATVGPYQAEATLDVTPGVGVVDPGLAGVDIYDPGYVVQHGFGHGGEVWVEDVFDHGGVHVGGPGVVDEDLVVAPSADVARLRFVPDVLRLSPGSPPTAVQVVEVLANGLDGRDVTADPALELTPTTGVVAVEKTPAGPVLRSTGAGQTTVAARLGNLTAEPLLVTVGDLAAGLGRLVLTPNPLALWSGETASFSAVMLDPGGGQPLRPIDYKIAALPGQGIVAAAGDQMIQGLGDGVTQVVVTAVDPGGAYDGLSATATVQVSSATPISIAPASVELKTGETVPPLSVTTRGENGLPLPVPAVLESMDPNVVAPDPVQPDRFVAQGLGTTQIRATYRGQQAFALVTIAGQRFLQVTETFNGGPDDFDVGLEVLAAETEGPLEYRVYVAGQPAAENWVPSQSRDGFRHVVLRSPRMRYGPQGSIYQLIVEARSPSGGSVQQYPFSFRLTSTIERTDVPPSAQPIIPTP